MSNFICSECGMTNIDCGRDGYKTPKEIELEKKVHILNEAGEKNYNSLCAEIEKNNKLEKQLAKANDIIKYYAEKHGKLKACDYLNKWGVK